MAGEPLTDPAPQGAGGGKSGEAIGLPSIPGYRIEETLGRGSTGVVFRATQLAVDREVALKVLHPDLAGRPRAVRRLQREARTTARLAHPNIVAAIDMGQIGPLWWYAMELVEGESLAERLKRVGRLTEREALRLFAPLVDALDHASRQGVVHRDIKPANVLIDKAGRPRLVDLGLAFREEDPLITKPGGTLGTPHYVSPEQARNPAAADVRSDIWSLGATLYHAVCGQPPFAGESVAEILSSVLYGRVLDPREVEPRLSRSFALVLRKCLSRNPEQRYQTPRELLEELERLREKRQVSVRSKGLDPVRREHAWRARAPWIAGALALAALAGWQVARELRGDPQALGEPLSGTSTWDELEELQERVRGPDLAIARSLVELVDLGPAPRRYEMRYQEVEEALLRRFREAQAAFASRLSADLERLLVARDFVGAQRLVRGDLLGRLRDELAPTDDQVELLLARLRPQELAARVQRELDAYVADLARRIEEHFQSAVFARVENDLRAGQWRTAREELERDPLTRLAEANIVTAGLPAERQRELEQGIRDALDARLAELDRDWIALDEELVGLLQQEAERLAEALRQRRPIVAAEDELRAALARRQQELRLTEEQRLTEVSDRTPGELERLARELRELEARLLEEDALAWLESERSEAQRLREQRRFGELLRIWQHALERDWLAPVREEIELEQRAASLLEDLLARAAAGVLEADGDEVSVLVGSIERRGVLEAGVDPLELGFRLRPEVGGTVQLALRPLERLNPRPTVLGPDALERFAGLPAAPHGGDPVDALARALLRYHEGDSAGALAHLPEQPPEDPVLRALFARVAAEVGRVVEERQVERERRAREAAQRLNVVRRTAGRAQHVGEAEAVARKIEELLDEYGDVDEIRAATDELRRLREELLAPRGPVREADLVEAFGPSEVSLSGGRARMLFDFSEGYSGKWARGDWVADAESWHAPSFRSSEQVAAEVGWPRLVLRPPIDIEGPLEARFTFEQPKDSGPPGLLVVSVAGVHVVVSGARAGEPARCGMATGGLEELRGLIRDLEREGQPFPGLARGERYTLVVELQQSRGKATVSILGRDAAGVELGERAQWRHQGPRPAGKPGSNSLVLRSIEPVRLLEARLVARVQ